MKLPKLPLLGRSKVRFELTQAELELIEICSKPGIGHLEGHDLLDEASLSPDRRGPIEEIIRRKVMEGFLKSAKERHA